MTKEINIPLEVVYYTLDYNKNESNLMDNITYIYDNVTSQIKMRCIVSLTWLATYMMQQM